MSLPTFSGKLIHKNSEKLRRINPPITLSKQKSASNVASEFSVLLTITH